MERGGGALCWEMVCLSDDHDDDIDDDDYDTVDIDDDEWRLYIQMQNMFVQ